MASPGQRSESATAVDKDLETPSVSEWPPYCNPNYIMPDVIESKCHRNGVELVSSVVKVSREDSEKPYLGGYRNNKSGHTYHHACTQTASQNNTWKRNDHLRNRDTQTCEVQTRSANTVREYGTQMVRSDLHMSNENDRHKISKPYFSSASLLQVKKVSTILIQRIWRGYLARQRTKFIKHKIESTEKDKIKIARNQKIEAEKVYNNEVERRVNPQTRKDFEVLYNELEAWRQREDRKIKEANLNEHERGLAKNQLLAKEIKLLQTIDRLKISAYKEGRDEKIRGMLKLMSAPKQWELSDGEIVEVHTPLTVRAKELSDLYISLSRQAPSTDERLNVLLNLKWTVTEFDCPLTREIVDLIDREADLLNRGRSEKSLVGLRVRLNNLTLQFLETPEFNVEAGRFLKVQYSKVRPLYPAVIGNIEPPKAAV